MMERRHRLEFGDFQTPVELAASICSRLVEIGIQPHTVVEPTCGVGAFVQAAARSFPNTAQILGFDIHGGYLQQLRAQLPALETRACVQLEHADFFCVDWMERVRNLTEPLLVIGNFPWVTSSTQSAILGSNLPTKSNFQKRSGIDAITGKANFDISEWMLLEVLRWLHGRRGDVAMLVKTSVARKVLAQAHGQRAFLYDAAVFHIDARKYFGAAVDACLLVMRFSPDCVSRQDYRVYADLSDPVGRRVGHRGGLPVSDVDAFDRWASLVGSSPQKWRSGVKHDASAVMELTRIDGVLINGLGERVDIEPTYCFPLMKGSDVGAGRAWREKFVLVPQRVVGEATEPIRALAPRTWAYLVRHGGVLDARRSTIYQRNPRFSIFGVGDYAFHPWKIAICGLYKSLRFQLIGPVQNRPVMFDDTVYYISFDTEAAAREVLDALQSESATELLRSLIFWDEKRPVKASVLNLLDWSRVGLAQEEGEPVAEECGLFALVD
jgi:hypothetical protein